VGSTSGWAKQIVPRLMGAHSMYEITFSDTQVHLMVPLQPVTVAASEFIAL